MLREHRRSIPREGELAGERGPAHDAEGIEITRRRGRITADQFGGEVPRRAEDRSRVDGITALRESEVAEQRAPRVPLNEDVVEGEISVHHAVGVGVVERPGDLPEDARGVVGGQWPATPEPGPERLAVDHRHHQQRRRVRFLHGIDRHDVRMGQRRGGACLAQEAGTRLGVGGQCGMQRLDRDRPLKAEVARQIDGPHPAAAEFTLE